MKIFLNLSFPLSLSVVLIFLLSYSTVPQTLTINTPAVNILRSSRNRINLSQFS